jgi:hypothetical protein
LTALRGADDNGFVVRQLLFAALLCVSAWALADRADACACGHGSAVASTAWSVSDAPTDGTGSDDSWVARHASSISLTPSGWRAQLSCTDVQREPGRVALHLTDHTPAFTRPPPQVFTHLQHIPLLI